MLKATDQGIDFATFERVFGNWEIDFPSFKHV